LLAGNGELPLSVTLTAGQAATGKDFFAQQQADLTISKEDYVSSVVAGTSTTSRRRLPPG